MVFGYKVYRGLGCASRLRFLNGPSVAAAKVPEVKFRTSDYENVFFLDE